MSTQQEKTPTPVILLVSTAHSGSTILDQVMDSHSKVAGIGELSQYHLNTRVKTGICSCGVDLVQCDFWNNVFSDIDSNVLAKCSTSTISFVLNNAKYFRYDDSNEPVNAQVYASITEAVYERILKYSGKEVILDSSKNMDRAEIINAFSRNLNVVFLHLVRDGRAVSYSMIKRKLSPFYAMKTWVKSNAKVEIMKLRNPDTPYVYIRYEDFVEDPERTLTYVLRQVNQSFEPEMLRFHDKIHHQCGGAAAVRRRKSPRNIQLDAQWKDKLLFRHKVLFNVLFGWVNMFYRARSRRHVC